MTPTSSSLSSSSTATVIPSSAASTTILAHSRLCCLLLLPPLDSATWPGCAWKRFSSGVDSTDKVLLKYRHLGVSVYSTYFKMLQELHACDACNHLVVSMLSPPTKAQLEDVHPRAVHRTHYP
ncbi:hypothetical protein Vafri_1364 [Volvox africanus]|nr:hypothetical protein Vafri_1364 [Volvox africanus]